MLESFDIAALAKYRRSFFVVRSDFADKPGGDVDLARQLSQQAQQAGARAELVPAAALPRDLGADDLLFLFNIDRPFDALLALGQAPRETRALLYTLHHPIEGVRRYLRHVGGAKRLFGTLAGNEPGRYEALVDLAKGARGLDLRRIGAALSRGRTIRRLLDRCELLVVAEAELAQIEQCFGTATRGAKLLPHPVATYAAPEAVASDYILVPGRIEPRKNQLAALRALTGMGLRERGYEIVVIGGSGSDAAYFRQVADFAAANGIVLLSHLPKAAFFPAVSAARLVINASFFEVTSLIDLYSIAYGIPLVTTRFAYYAQSSAVVQMDPEAWSSDQAAVSAAIEPMLARGLGAR